MTFTDCRFLCLTELSSKRPLEISPSSFPGVISWVFTNLQFLNVSCSFIFFISALCTLENWLYNVLCCPHLTVFSVEVDLWYGAKFKKISKMH